MDSDVIKRYREQCYRDAMTYLKDHSNYEYIDSIGTGAFGDIIKIRDRNTNIIKAAKVIAAKYVTKREFQIWGNLYHENILPLEEVLSLTDGTTIATMPLSFSDLRSIVRHENFQNNKSGFVSITRWIYDIVKALDYMHANNLCHLDVKTNNVLINHSGSAVLCDFTTSREAHKDIDCKYVGLPKAFRPPECFTRNATRCKVNGQALDMWATGIMIAELFSREYVNRNVTKTDYWRTDIKPVIRQITSYKTMQVALTTFFPLHQFDWFGIKRIVDFMNRFLDLSPNSRITARDALQHPVLIEASSVCVRLEEMFPRRQGDEGTGVNVSLTNQEKEDGKVPPGNRSSKESPDRNSDIPDPVRRRCQGEEDVAVFKTMESGNETIPHDRVRRKRKKTSTGNHIPAIIFGGGKVRKRQFLKVKIMRRQANGLKNLRSRNALKIRRTQNVAGRRHLAKQSGMKLQECISLSINVQKQTASRKKPPILTNRATEAGFGSTVRRSLSCPELNRLATHTGRRYGPQSLKSNNGFPETAVDAEQGSKPQQSRYELCDSNDLLGVLPDRDDADWNRGIQLPQQIAPERSESRQSRKNYSMQVKTCFESDTFVPLEETGSVWNSSAAQIGVFVEWPGSEVYESVELRNASRSDYFTASSNEATSTSAETEDFVSLSDISADGSSQDVKHTQQTKANITPSNQIDEETKQVTVGDAGSFVIPEAYFSDNFADFSSFDNEFNNVAENLGDEAADHANKNSVFISGVRNVVVESISCGQEWPAIFAVEREKSSANFSDAFVQSSESPAKYREQPFTKARSDIQGSSVSVEEGPVKKRKRSLLRCFRKRIRNFFKTVCCCCGHLDNSTE